MIHKKQFLIVGLLLLFGKTLFAQRIDKNQIKFRSYNEAGLSVGANSNALFINSVNGFEKKKIFVGLGLGADFYYHTSIPVYIQGNYSIPLKKNFIQLTAGGGINKPMSKPNPKYESPGDFDYGSGYYAAAGLQYLVKLTRNKIYFGSGYTEKQMFKTFDMSLIDPSTQGYANRADIRFKRMYLKAGIIF